MRTYGCQMNVHDSERLSGLLEAAGYSKAAEDSVADVVVFNTCAVRENADNRLYGNLSHLVPVKAENPGMQIAVGGCLAQKDRGAVLAKAPWVDVRVRQAMAMALDRDSYIDAFSNISAHSAGGSTRTRM